MFLSPSLGPTLPFASLSQSSYLVLPVSSSYSSAFDKNLRPQIKGHPHNSNYHELPDPALLTANQLDISNSISHPENISSFHDEMNHDFNTAAELKHHNLTEENPNKQTLEYTIAIVVPILFGLICIIGLFGNALVVIVVVFNASMRSTTNLLILNLAIADLLFILFCVPFTASDYAIRYWPFGEIWCKTVQYLILVLACASNYTLVLMSLDRYLAVVHPISSMSIRTAKNAYISICFIWVFIIAACMPAIQTHTIIKYGDNINDTFMSCTFNSTSNLTHTQFQLGFMISSYVIPLLIAFVLYFLMLKKLWFGSSSVNSRLNNVRCRKRVTRMVIIVVLTFAVCWAPIQIILVLKALNMYHTNKPHEIVLQIAAQIFAYMNSCVNPILYAFLSENFRKAFHKAIACNLGGIYGIQQTSYMQTGQTSVANPQSNYMTPIRTNSQMRRNNALMKNDVNNNDKDALTPDIIESQKCLKNVNFSVVVDGGLFPRSSSQVQQTKQDCISGRANDEDTKSSETTATLKNNKQANVKPILSSKGRFKASCLDDEAEDHEEFANKMELHPTNIDATANTDFIPMHEISSKTVPSSVDDSTNESTTTNDTMNKADSANNNNTNSHLNNSTSTPPTATAMDTMAKMPNANNGVFL